MLGVIFLSPIALLAALQGYIAVTTTEFAATNKRIVGKRGLLRSRTIETSIGKVESVVVDVPILGRLLGFGTVTVVGTGGSRNPFTYVRDAVAFRQTLLELTAG